MRNLKISVRHRRVIKPAAVSLIIFSLLVSLSAFINRTGNADIAKASVGSYQLNKYPFATTTTDPSKVYVIKLNSKAVSFVQKYIEVEGERLQKMKTWGKAYFEMYDRILSHYGLPKELKYLSVIESDLISKAVSVSGAAGPWQIMSDEAIRMGLRVDSKVDERTNFRKSTHAAAKILKELYSQFNDWTLVIAAYNCGAGRVRQAIRKSGSKNFWALQSYLPLETRCHVKRFMGTHYLFEGSGGLTTMTASEVKRYELKIEAFNRKQFKTALADYRKGYLDLQYQLL